MSSRATGSSKSKTGSKTKPAGSRAKPARAAAKAVAAPTAAPEPGVVTETKAVVNGAELKKKELLDAVIERSGVRKKFAKPVVEAMIDILGEAIAEGREINLQPFGKIKHQRMVDSSNARVMVTKIRQSKSAAPALDPGDRADLEEGEDSSKESVADPAE